MSKHALTTVAPTHTHRQSGTLNGSIRHKKNSTTSQIRDQTWVTPNTTGTIGQSGDVPVGGIPGAAHKSVRVSRRSRICCDGKGVSRRGNTSVKRQNKITLQSRLPSHSHCVYLWTTTGRVLTNHRSEASLERDTRERARMNGCVLN
jgi:hypothetical protein